MVGWSKGARLEQVKLLVQADQDAGSLAVGFETCQIYADEGVQPQAQATQGTTSLFGSFKKSFGKLGSAFGMIG